MMYKSSKDFHNFDDEFGLDLSTGFFLYGPSGCGKTLVGNAAGVSFRHIKGLDILNEYVGAREINVRKIFDVARTCAPSSVARCVFVEDGRVIASEVGTEPQRHTKCNLIKMNSFMFSDLICKGEYRRCLQQFLKFITQWKHYWTKEFHIPPKHYYALNSDNYMKEKCK
ncbi:hypothetical protein Fmac_001809 [Flemingia macrophylla]|uniref:ATPase AAA-type core domain-containing protein n=1 Tax=Flemingia macrophylla TaxID=520843 RepID=A0ABD1NI62_9FABA